MAIIPGIYSSSSRRRPCETQPGAGGGGKPGTFLRVDIVGDAEANDGHMAGFSMHSREYTPVPSSVV